MRSSNRRTLFLVLLVALLLVGGVALFRRHSGATGPAISPSGARAPELEAAERASQRAPTDPLAPPSLRKTRIRVVEFGTKAPILAASIRIEPAHGDDVELVTDAEGVAQCDTALLEESWIEIHAEHYSSVRIPIPVRPERDLELTLFGTGDLLVHVRDDLGAPMPQAILLPELIDTHLSQEQRDAIVAGWPDWYSPKTKPWTDDAGDRRIDDLPRGLKLTVTALNSKVEVTLDRATPLTEITIVVPMNRCIHGRLVWEDGSPVKDHVGIESFVVGDPNGPWSRGTSNAEGRFELCRLPPGRVNWKVMYTGELVRCLPADLGVMDPVNRVCVVDVGDIVLQRVLECHGRVRFSDAPSDYDYWNVQLHVWHGGLPLGPGMIQHDGTFTLRIPPGPATLALILGWKPVTSIQVVSPFDGLVIDLDPFAGRLRIDNVPIPRRTELVVQLHDEPAAWSIRNREGERSRRGFTNISDADVSWCDASLCIKDVAPGETDVFATDRKDTWFLGHALVVAGRETVIDAALVQPGTIRVLARDGEGKPVEKFAVEASMSAGLTAQFPTRVGTTNAEGEALLAGIAPGRWIVFPRGHGELAEDAQVVDVPSGATASIEMISGGHGSVAGQVTFGDAPAREIGVSLAFSGFGASGWHGFLPGVTTDEEGKYRFDRVVPGRYGISFWRSGGSGRPPLQTRSRFVDVHAGEAAVCDIDLDSSCRRLVFQRDGQPWTGVDAGKVYTPDGSSSIEPRPEFEGGLGAFIPKGPCLFVLKSKDVPLRDEHSEQENFYVHVPAVDASSAPIVVDLRGGRIDVHLAGESSQLPVAHVRSIDGCPINAPFGSSWGWAPRSAHEDAAGVRSFTHLPVGATVVLASERNLPGGALELEVHVVNEGTIDVTWPPH